MSDKINVSEIHCTSDHKIGVLELDNPASLNALTLDMLKVIKQKLVSWQEDNTVLCVIITATENKAFCAGGDVRAMYDAIENDPAITSQLNKKPSNTEDYIDRVVNTNSCSAVPFLTEYFSTEYHCDYLIHTYNKPIIAWANGLVMGGGLGLFIGASHRVVTPNAVMAMPEMNIGLYPDVGATWFLNQLPAGIGLFLGLTGAQVNAGDASDLEIADYLIVNDYYDEFIDQLKQYSWQQNADSNSNPLPVDKVVTDTLNHFSELSAEAKPASQMIPYFSQLQAACINSDLNVVYEQIQAIDGMGRWIEKAKNTLITGSPITAHICFRQMQHYRKASLAECFKMELSLSIRCGLLGEFKEGVRARLIEKDQKPQWLYSAVDKVDPTLIDCLFTSLWPEDKHPLRHLQ